MITLDHTYLRDTYLRGIDLGAAWGGNGGNVVMDQILHLYEEIAEARLGVLLCRRRIVTYADMGVTQGQQYEIVGLPFPYLQLASGVLTYTLILPYPNVQSIERVRVFEGYDLTPAPIFETIPITAVDLSTLDGKVRFASNTVTAPQLAQSWAVDYTIGLGHIPAELIEWITLRAAVRVLSLAASGADISHGRSGESLNQDGVVETHSFGTGVNGPYSGTLMLLGGLLADMEMTSFWRSLRIRLQGTRWAAQGWQQP